MKTIKLTDATNAKVIHVCPEHIVAYWWQDSGHTYIMLNGGGQCFATTRESPDEIDNLLMELP